MASTYKQFLAAPNTSLLAPDASLHYITTATAIHGATDIIKHFNTLRNQVKRKKEEFLDVIEGQNAAAIQVDSTLEFVTSGGPYLPGLDDNFLADRTVYLPIMHLVALDGNGRISQIRQSWDQGSLLKQLEVIGRTGRNWPIRDGPEQLRLISQCLKKAGAISSPPDTNEITARSRGNSTNALRDPHASLALFGPREDTEQAASATVVSPYAGTRPRERSFTEILGDEPEEEETSPTRGRSQSPSKVRAPKGGAGKNYHGIRLFEAEEEAERNGQERGRSESPSKAIAPKIGAGKNFQPSRLFEEEDAASHDTPVKTSPERFYRPNVKKYQHFDFADGSDPQDTPKPGVPLEARPKSKHDSSWSFDDFVTPQKPLPSRTAGRRDERHWDTEPTAVPETPGQPAVKPRRDAQTHFEFIDDGPTPDNKRQSKPRGAMHNTGLGLYDNNLYNEDGSAPAEPDSRALGNITNLKDRQKTFESSFDMTDEPDEPVTQQQQKVSDDRKKAVKMMEASWEAYDESPVSQKENQPSNGGAVDDDRGINIAGDGMGGRKGANRDWLYGDEQRNTPKAVPGKKPGRAAADNRPFWEY